ncbi:hypothetical protein [Adhaeribacter radiodurans]|uniref:Glycosyltransferase family 39 protein n=1 Tax=Adhaeribacter radiodurans TaxID=2745197 RepID=A0A7L7L481_9BACT|nr:hypothetical protein [Adhaeribacter radiodurans]QMU27574.1 hypothetical protein HUW48_05745 [Adhaeribacter radiodurans]
MFYAIAYWVRPLFTNRFTEKYFVPALTVKFIGAIGLGIIYQYYYGGGRPSGDTFNYYNQSKVIYEAFDYSFKAGLKLLLANGELDIDTHNFASKISWYHSPTEYFIIKLAAFFGLLCFQTYTVIGLFFALVSFSGMWAMYRTFLKLFPHLYKEFAIAVFFLPSVFFWGSGLLKDSITIGALGWLFYGFYATFIQKKKLLLSGLLTFVAAYVIYSVKIYILLSFLPPALFWVFIENNNKIKNVAIRNLTKPVFLLIGLAGAYIGATRLTEGDRRYDLDKITQTSQINTIYLTEQVKTGSAYNIGIFDGSISSLLKVGPQAVIVALYRPFLWEVRNPVMLLSAIEASIFIFLTLRFFFKTGFFKTLKLISSKPILTFCFLFSIVFAFGVGTNSGNFGTLVRYKIPLMPFYLSALYIMQSYTKRPKKLVRLLKTA